MTDRVVEGQVWVDEESGHVRVLAVRDEFAMLRRRRRRPFIATTGQMLAGEYGWRLLHDVPVDAESPSP